MKKLFWVCPKCHRDHNYPHIPRLFSFEKQVLYCPHCGWHGDVKKYNLIDVVRQRGIYRFVIMLLETNMWWGKEIKEKNINPEAFGVQDKEGEL